MRGKTSLVARIVMTVSLALVVTACRGEGDATTSSGAVAPTAATTPEPPDGTGDTRGGAGPGPDAGETLADYFGTVDFSDGPEAAAAEALRVQTEIQDGIRRCMAEQGFEYLPVLPPGAATSRADGQQLAETHGFGITTVFANGTPPPTEDWSDPNQERVDAMSPAEQDAYFTALHGSPDGRDTVTEVDPETGVEFTYPEGPGSGCTGIAFEQVYGDRLRHAEVWEQLGPELDAMQRRIEADARIVAAEERWSGCMAAAGHSYDTRSTMVRRAFTDLQTRFEAIVATDAVDQEALAALQQEEIDLAVADHACAEGLEELYAEVAQTYESEFVAENRETLEAIRDERGAG